jgi:hypothetical protein
VELVLIGRVRVNPVRSTLLGACDDLYSVRRGIILCHGRAAAADLAENVGEGESKPEATVRDETNLEQKKRKKKKP